MRSEEISNIKAREASQMLPTLLRCVAGGNKTKARLPVLIGVAVFALVAYGFASSWKGSTPSSSTVRASGTANGLDHMFWVNRLLTTPCVYDYDVAAGKTPGYQDVQEHPHLIEFISKHVLKRVEIPADRRFKDPSFNLVDPSDNEGMKKMMIPMFIQNAALGPPGTFFESGCLDMNTSSVTYYLEQKFGWSGLLVEPLIRGPEGDPNSNAKHFGRSRGLTAQACVAPQRSPCSATMLPTTIGNTIQSSDTPPDAVTVDCYPLTSLLLAAKLTELDFLAIDTETTEVFILQTVNWDLIKAKVIRLDNSSFVKNSTSMTQRMHELLTSKGYTHHPEVVKNPYWYEWDSHIYTRN